MRSSSLLARLLVPALLLALLACGGGGSGPDPVGGGTSWDYVALGDSLAFGVGANTGGYVPRYRDHIVADTGHEVELTNLGVPGWNSTDLYNAVRNDQQFREALQDAEVVTWNIGGNDMLAARSRYMNGTCGGGDNQDCLRETVTQFRSNWDGIVAEIEALRSSSTTILRTMDVYNPFVAELRASGDLDELKPYLDQINAHIAQSAQANQVPMAKVYEAFNGADGEQDAGGKGYISNDQLHPDDEGYAKIAELLRGLGYAPLE